ncbi:hypothetical protein SFUMM280S_06942 [Streptomyces fumanus]
MAAGGPRQGQRKEHLFVDRQDATPYAPEFSARADGDGYRRELVTVSLTRYARVRGALLTPHGPGPFPAVLLLHDHGSRSDIGKEKLVRPWYDGTRRAAAEEWAARRFDSSPATNSPGAAMWCSASTPTAGATASPSPTSTSRPSPAPCCTSAARWPG